MTNKEPVEQLLLRHRHSRAWNARRGIGTFLTIEVGKEVKPDSGQLHIWVQYATWTLEFRGHPILSSGSSHATEYAEALANLEGQQLEDIAVHQESGHVEVVVSFSSDLALRLSSDQENYETEDDMISLFDTNIIVSISATRGVYAESSE
ncbi:MAG: hypothetical protein HC927_04190 [Deltaproteobacteria bacterium]|nr:hypothetical protein [Deltaproteobacteria bacterium]